MNYQSLGYHLDTFRKFGGKPEELPYIEPCGVYNASRRLYIDLAACKDYEQYQAKAEIAKAGYFMQYSLFRNDFVRVDNAPELVAEPPYKVEYIPAQYITDKPITKVWINCIGIDTEEVYTRVKYAAEKEAEKMQELIAKHGAGLAQFQTGWKELHTTRFCSRELKGDK